MVAGSRCVFPAKMTYDQVVRRKPPHKSLGGSVLVLLMHALLSCILSTHLLSFNLLRLLHKSTQIRPLALNLLPITRVYFIFFKTDCLRVCNNTYVDAALDRLNNAPVKLWV
jgi:hypothetical protein